MSRAAPLLVVSLFLLLLNAGTTAALDPQPPELVSVRWDTGEPSFGVCAAPHFSHGSRFLVFGCLTSELVPDDSNPWSDNFLLDRQTGVIELISVSSEGQQMNYPSGDGRASMDGGRVVFVGTGPLHPDYGPPPPNDFGHTAVYQFDGTRASHPSVSVGHPVLRLTAGFWPSPAWRTSWFRATATTGWTASCWIARPA